MKMTNKLKCHIKGIRKKKCKPRVIVRPIVRRYFYICTHNIVLVDTPYTINADRFIDDEGKPVHAFETFGLSGYINLFINGVMQGSSFYKLSPSSIQLNPTMQVIYENTPIIIESIGFKLIRKK